MNIKAKLASLAAVAIIVGTQYPIASNADQPVLQAGDYIVVFDNQANEQAEAAKLRSQGANITYTYSAVFKGLAGSFNSAQINALQKNPNVKSIEADGFVKLNETASWGLDRIDDASLPLDHTYVSTKTGEGVNAYVIDTGIASNTDFGNRLRAGYSAIGKSTATKDCNGHGTHVAGTIGGTVYGVAKSVTLYPVRVLDCFGSGRISGVISGVDWVRKNAIIPAVANMSLGGGASSTLDSAVNNLILSGVIVAVAAGNDSKNACGVSPARVSNAITVGATDSSDKIAYFSNFGACLDVFAPGVDITSIDISTGGSVAWDGTSMATPHVAGVAALWLQGKSSTTSSHPSDFNSWLDSNAQKVVILMPTVSDAINRSGTTTSLVYTNGL